MKPSGMRHRITVQERSQSSDSQGGYTETWSTHDTVWAKIEPVSSRERFFSGKLEHNVTHKITIRHLSTLTTDMRIQYDSRTFKIAGITNFEERDRYQELMCEEGAGS